MSDAIPIIRLKRLWWIGPLTVLASVIGVLIVRTAAVAILRPEPQPMSLGWGAPIGFTFILVSGAAGVFALIVRFAKNPIRAYQIVALVVLMLSFLPDIAYGGSTITGASWPSRSNSAGQPASGSAPPWKKSPPWRKRSICRPMRMTPPV